MSQGESIHFCSACGSEVERREAFGRMRPVCPRCGRVHFEDPKVAAAVLVVEQGKVLLVRRVNAPFEGTWTLPAGFVDADEDPKEAAARECLEETGLEVHITHLLDVIAGKEHGRGASIVVVYRAEVVGGQLAARDDAGEAAFFPPHDLPALGFAATRAILERWRSADFGVL